jgi:hypothetical protein
MSHFWRYRGYRLPFFMFSALGHVFGGTEGVWSLFHVFCSQTHFRRYRGRRFPFSCSARPDSFSAVPRASDPISIFCTLGLVFGGTEGVGSSFHVLRARTRFRRYQVRRVPFSYFALPDSFSAVPMASGLVFMFCSLGHVFDGIEGVQFRFHVLHSRTCFRRCRVHRVQFSIFALPNSFSAVPKASGPVFIFCAPGLVSAVLRATSPVFMFCAPGLVFRGTEGVGSRFYVSRSHTRFRRYRGCRVPFFYAPKVVSHGNEGVGSRFHVLRSKTLFRRYRGRRVLFSCVFTPRLIFCGAECVGSRFHVLRARTHFRRYRGRLILFSSFPVPRASGPVFVVCTPGIVSGGTEGVGSRFLVLGSRTHFSWYRESQVTFSCFDLTDSFSAVWMVSGHVFMFCAPELFFDGAEGSRSRFHVLCSRARFRRYGGHRVTFLCFDLTDSFSAVRRVSDPVSLGLRALAHFRRF